jgi:hypothetical protein
MTLSSVCTPKPWFAFARPALDMPRPDADMLKRGPKKKTDKREPGGIFLWRLVDSLSVVERSRPRLCRHTAFPMVVTSSVPETPETVRGKSLSRSPPAQCLE